MTDTTEPGTPSLEDATALIETATALGGVVPAPAGTTVWVVSIPPFASPGPGAVLGTYSTYQQALAALAAHAVAEWERRDVRQQGWIEPRPWFSHEEHEAFHTSMNAEERLYALDRFHEAKARWLATATPAQIADGWYRTLAMSGSSTDHRQWVTEHRVNEAPHFPPRR